MTWNIQVPWRLSSIAPYPILVYVEDVTKVNAAFTMDAAHAREAVAAKIENLRRMPLFDRVLIAMVYIHKDLLSVQIRLWNINLDCNCVVSQLTELIDLRAATINDVRIPVEACSVYVSPRHDDITLSIRLERPPEPTTVQLV